MKAVSKKNGIHTYLFVKNSIYIIDTNTHKGKLSSCINELFIKKNIMDLTYGFFGLIIYLFTFLGCGNTSNYSPPPKEESAVEKETTVERTPIHEKEYNLSLEQWEKEKKAHNNSYQYTLFFENSMGTFKFETTIFVKNGIVYAREKEAFLRNSETQKMELDKAQSWKETKEQLGTHDKYSGFPKTMNELYEDCDRALRVDPNSNDIIFRMDNNQLLSSCGYTPEACADDCFKGVTIKDFKWLD